jgi:hypothetical protein
MVLLTMVVVLAADPAPPSSQSRAPLGVAKPRPPTGRAPLPAPPSPDGNGTAEPAESTPASDGPGATGETPHRGVELTLVPIRKRPTPDDLWSEKPPPVEPAGGLSQKRALRFVGALLGGAVGLGVPLLLLPLADVSCRAAPGAFSGCPTSAHFFVGAGSLVGAMGGAAAGFAIAGGEPSTGALVAGHVGGLLLSLLLSAVVASSGQALGDRLSIPVLVSAGALVVGGQAMALMLRDDSVEGRRWLPSSASRFALTSLTFLGTAAVSAFVVGATAALASLPAIVIGGSIATGLSLLATWAVHRGLGGQGSFVAALLGLLGAGLVGMLGGGLFAATMNGPAFGTVDGGRLRAGAVSALMVGSVLVGALAVPMALEVGHGIALSSAREEAGLALSGAPVPGGAVGVLTARF